MKGSLVKVKVHYFQRYHTRENVHTSNAMLLLSRLYFYSPAIFYKFVSHLFDDEVELVLSFIIQDKTSKGTIPDATISQPSFMILIETKLAGNFSTSQLKGHLKKFHNEDYRILLTLDKNEMDDNYKNKLKRILSEYKNIHHTHLTFLELIQSIERVITDRDYEMNEVLDDYREYCSKEQLFPTNMMSLRVQRAGTTLTSNKELNLYYNKFNRGFSGQKYLGLYKNKSVRLFGKIIAIVVAQSVNGELDCECELGGTVTEYMKEKINNAIEDARKKYDWYIGEEKHRYFFVDNFYEIEFNKTTKGALMGSKNFDLCEVLGEKNLPEDTAEIAKLLNKKEWQ